ncbi:MAG: ABC transporter permease [Thermoplasmata archaeon]
MTKEVRRPEMRPPGDAFLLTESRREKLYLFAKSLRQTWKLYRQSRAGMIGLAMILFFVLMAVFAPLLSTHESPWSLGWRDVNPQYAPPSFKFPFGTDYYGRDMWTLTVVGSRASLIVGFIASLISIVIGTGVGLGAGYFGKVADESLMRLTDFFLVLPWFPLMIVFMMLFGQSFTNVIVVIGIVSWPSTARIVRAQVLSVKERVFVERAKAIGAGSGRIIWRHILPNVFPLIFANTILLIANSIFSESFLDFFGLGDPKVVSWGTMLEASYEYHAFEAMAWWVILPPGISIIILIMAFYLVGDALDEVLNPKLRRR